jgi:hypothetical protein
VAVTKPIPWSSQRVIRFDGRCSVRTAQIDYARRGVDGSRKRVRVQNILSGTRALGHSSRRGECPTRLYIACGCGEANPVTLLRPLLPGLARSVFGRTGP